ncbi:rod shape-determining protein [uncultured Anaerococcus sp.]|uniref:Ppx/GppA phosphatase family protein n=1 Tax=uncultured Anaerococcus sp. TaxID=293428 RepID=UPI0025D9DFE0|nr:rod shape-determining protein [uncultured Anaerococcus sp.]
MIYAIMDIGSNTVRLSVYKEKDGEAVNLFSEKEQVSLKSYVKDGRLSKKGIKRLYRTLSKFKAVVDNFGDIDGVYPFATATVRDVANRSDILSLMKNDLDLDIEILSGEEEAKLAFVGAAVSSEIKEGVLCDIGGGSTEVVLIDQGKVIKSQSLSIGSLSAFNDYVDGLFADKSSKKKIEKRLIELFDNQSMYREDFKVLSAVGGTARAALKVYREYYDLEDNIRSMKADDFNQMVKDLVKKSDTKKMRLILDVKPDRIHTLLPGMLIMNQICKFFSVKTINVSQTGVREGYVYSKLLRKE